MDTGLLRLCLEVIKDNIQSQEFNELLLETGISLDNPEWEITNKMLSMAEDVLMTLGEAKGVLH